MLNVTCPSLVGCDELTLAFLTYLLGSFQCKSDALGLTGSSLMLISQAFLRIVNPPPVLAIK